MTYFPDGSTYSYTAGEADAVNIGWLDAKHTFPTEEPSAAFVAALARLCRHGVKPMRGYHRCELCRHSDGDISQAPARAEDLDGEFPLGSAEIRVRAPTGVVFAAPNLIIHYVTVHKYRPPDAFHEAVLA
jgi:hypothetical protein